MIPFLLVEKYILSFHFSTKGGEDHIAQSDRRQLQRIRVFVVQLLREADGECLVSLRCRIDTITEKALRVTCSFTTLILERDLELHTVGKRLPRLNVDVLLDNASDSNVPQGL
jgi:hypothetical protein